MITLNSVLMINDRLECEEASGGLHLKMNISILEDLNNETGSVEKPFCYSDFVLSLISPVYFVGCLGSIIV